jgi:hypothetical protein
VKRKARALIIGAAVVVAIAALVLFAFRPGRDDFKFLGGRGPVGVTVGQPTAHSASQNPFEVRVYSWHADFSETRTQMDVELRALGFKPIAIVGDDRFYGSWENESGKLVWVETGISPSVQAAMRGKKRQDPSAVTVVISEGLQDNWVSWLRLQFAEPL